MNDNKSEEIAKNSKSKSGPTKIIISDKAKKQIEESKFPEEVIENMTKQISKYY